MKRLSDNGRVYKISRRVHMHMYLLFYYSWQFLKTFPFCPHCDFSFFLSVRDPIDLCETVSDMPTLDKEGTGSALEVQVLEQ